MDLERHLRMTNEMYRFLFETDAKTAHIPRPPKNPKRMTVKVPLQGDPIPVILDIYQCRSCGSLCGLEQGSKTHCPYCQGELMVMEGE
jgi:DNA-directed RNA polymerase subunit RPC12/RpoP